MKIGINGRYLGPNKTGVGRYLYNLLKVWSSNARGHEFFVYYSSEKLQPEDQALAERGHTVRLQHVPRPMRTGSFHLWYNISLPRAVMRDGIDFFFSPDYFLPPLRRTIKRSLTIHDVSYLSHPDWFPPLYRMYCQLYSKRPARTADAVFTVSDFSKREIVKFTRTPEHRVIVTPEAADPSFRPSGVRRALSNFGIEKSYFLFVGKIFNRRHVDAALHAFKRYLASSRDTTTRFVIRGADETHPRIDIRGIAEKINADVGRDAVIFPEYVSDEDLVALYQQATGFFYLSDYEGFGLPIIEAMACGTPTVTVRSTSIPEVGGDAAIYVDPRRIDDIAAVMQQLVSDREWVGRIKDASLRQAGLFSWEDTATRTLEAIERSYAR